MLSAFKVFYWLQSMAERHLKDPDCLMDVFTNDELLTFCA